MTDISEISLTDAPFDEDPYPFFAALRREPGPVWSRRHKSWLIARQDDVRLALVNPKASVTKLSPFIAHMSGDARAALDRLNDVLRHWLVFQDAPDHTRLRLVLSTVFMPRDVARFEERIREIVVELFDEIEGRRELDVIQDLALAMPARLVCELFGVPVADADLMVRWGHGVSRFVMGAPGADKYQDSLADVDAMRAYFVDLLADRAQAEPEDGEDTLLQRLLVARTQDGGADGGLTDDEIVATLVLILFAGLDTTANAFGTMVLALLEHPAAFTWLREHPADADRVVEELLRFDSPAPVVTRIAAADLTVGGVDIRAGERMILLLGSANRDRPEVDGDTLAVGPDPSSHLAFGRGPHFCLGAPLARLELRVALQELVRRDVDWRLRPEGIVWRDELMVRGMVHLPVTVGGGAR